jgi:hypothetical protein
MSVWINKRFASIGSRSLRLEIGWFNGATPALLGVVLCEWLHVSHAGGLLYFCIFGMQVLKFTILLTLYPQRSPSEDFNT